MSSPEKLLPVLSPPPGGWERLQARRESFSSTVVEWLPLVSGGLAATVLAAVFLASRNEVRMPFNAARLMGERSEGVGLRMLDQRQMTALPSDDPNVRLYWVGPAAPASSD
jgi:hypothetical protein